MRILLWCWVILLFFSGAICSCKIGIDPDHRHWWTFWTWAFGAFTWPLVAYHTKDLIGDGLLFDVLLVVIYTTVFGIMAKQGGALFSGSQIFGVSCAIFGLLVFKSNP